jgi:hypothetical protein
MICYANVYLIYQIERYTSDWSMLVQLMFWMWRVVGTSADSYKNIRKQRGQILILSCVRIQYGDTPSVRLIERMMGLELEWQSVPLSWAFSSEKHPSMTTGENRLWRCDKFVPPSWALWCSCGTSNHISVGALCFLQVKFSISRFLFLFFNFHFIANRVTPSQPLCKYAKQSRGYKAMFLSL